MTWPIKTQIIYRRLLFSNFCLSFIGIEDLALSLRRKNMRVGIYIRSNIWYVSDIVYVRSPTYERHVPINDLRKFRRMTHPTASTLHTFTSEPFVWKSFWKQITHCFPIPRKCFSLALWFPFIASFPFELFSYVLYLAKVMYL